MVVSGSRLSSFLVCPIPPKSYQLVADLIRSYPAAAEGSFWSSFQGLFQGIFYDPEQNPEFMNTATHRGKIRPVSAGCRRRDGSAARARDKITKTQPSSLADAQDNRSNHYRDRCVRGLGCTLMNIRLCMQLWECNSAGGKLPGCTASPGVQCRRVEAK